MTLLDIAIADIRLEVDINRDVLTARSQELFSDKLRQIESEVERLRGEIKCLSKEKT